MYAFSCECALFAHMHQGRGPGVSWLTVPFHIRWTCRFDSLEALEAHIKSCPAEEKAALLAELNEMATKALERAAPRSGKALWGRAKVMIPVRARQLPSCSLTFVGIACLVCAVDRFGL